MLGYRCSYCRTSCPLNGMLLSLSLLSPSFLICFYGFITQPNSSLGCLDAFYIVKERGVAAVHVFTLSHFTLSSTLFSVEGDSFPTPLCPYTPTAGTHLLPFYFVFTGSLPNPRFLGKISGYCHPLLSATLNALGLSLRIVAGYRHRLFYQYSSYSLFVNNFFQTFLIFIS